MPLQVGLLLVFMCLHVFVDAVKLASHAAFVWAGAKPGRLYTSSWRTQVTLHEQSESTYLTDCMGALKMQMTPQAFHVSSQHAHCLCVSRSDVGANQLVESRAGVT